MSRSVSLPTSITTTTVTTTEPLYAHPIFAKKQRESLIRPAARPASLHAAPAASSQHFHSLPSPPLSAETSPSSSFEAQHTDPWSSQSSSSKLYVAVEERSESLQYRGAEEMNNLDSSLSGLEGSWRVEGPPPPRLMEMEKSGGSSMPWQPIQHVAADPPDVVHKSSVAGPSRKRGEVEGVLPVAVWASVMDSSKGRDKVLKCLQYSLRTYLYLLSLIANVRPLSRWFRSNQKRMGIAVSGLSLTRKCLLLLNPLHPLTHLLSPTPTSAPALLRHLIDLASAVSDDLYCLGRLGIVGRRMTRAADRWANRFWLLTTIMALYTLHLRTVPRLRRALLPTTSSSGDIIAPAGMSKAREDLNDAEWSNRKLLADLVFVSYDVFRISLLKEPIQCVAGLAAAFISTSKLYDQHWQASLGKG